uniref:Variant surface glycoprotein Sur n=1 Tax=Trypanosoma brucei rhodesiense TaxID=31286 RepID=A0A291L8F1_TRYBR|nr:variant surface glycoprotein Sur [Trypanosoma brucei rhodesiense]
MQAVTRFFRHLITLTAVALLAAFLDTVKAAKDTAAGHVTTPCTEILFDLTLAKHYENQIQAAESALSRNYAAIRSWTLLEAMSSDGNRQNAYTGLIAYGIQITVNAEEGLQGPKQTKLKAAHALRHRAANLSAALQIQAAQQATLTKPTAGGGQTPFSGAAGTCKYEGITATATAQSCKYSTEDEEKINAAHMNPEVMTQITTIGDAYLTTITLDAIAGSKGNPTKLSTTYAEQDCQDGGNTGPNFGGTNALGLKVTKLGTKATPETTNLYTAGGTECDNQPGNGPQATKQRLAYLVCEANKASIITPTDLQTLTLDALISAPEMTAIGDALLTDEPATEKEYSSAQHTQIQQLLKKAYGQTNEQFQKNFIKPLAAQTVKFKIGGAEVSNTVAALMSSPNSGLALAYHKGKNKLQHQVKPDTPLVESKKGSECQVIEDKEKCKTTYGCELKGDKCVVKMTTKGEVTGTQNTTGSNSFVIKKAPLLLAFLLF